MLLDHGFMCVVAGFFYLPLIIRIFAGIAGSLGGHEIPNPWSGAWMYVGMIGMALYPCKDCINGRSLAKRVMGHQVVSNKTGQVATPLQCLVRNLLIFIWPVEVIAVQFNPARRLGDKLAGTRVVTYDPVLEQPRLKPVKLVIPFIIAYCCILFADFRFIHWMKASIAQVYPQLQYDKASYNDRESKELQQLYKDSASDELEISPSVYDKNRVQPGIRYIVVNYYNKPVLGEEVSDSSAKAMITKCLYARYSKDSITGLARELRFGDNEEISGFPIGKVYPR